MCKEITPATVHAALAAVLAYDDIDHHYSDLYCKITPESRKIAQALDPKGHMVQIFRDQITGAMWYDIPFCYNPAVDAEHRHREHCAQIDAEEQRNAEEPPEILPF